MTVLRGRWQDVLPTLRPRSLDALFYDAYGEDYEDMQELHELLPTLLRPGGVYSFFNGFCPFNVIFREVACRVCQLELDELGLELAYTPLRVAIDESAWVGVSRRYYVRDTYHLPVATLRASAAEDAGAAEDAAEGAS